jgi:hypothetical protein
MPEHGVPEGAVSREDIAELAALFDQFECAFDSAVVIGKGSRIPIRRQSAETFSRACATKLFEREFHRVQGQNPITMPRLSSQKSCLVMPF